MGGPRVPEHAKKAATIGEPVGAGRLALVVLAVAVGAAGCARTQSATREWSAAIEVQGNRALVTVTVPGWQPTTDYHVHLALDGGPEVMAFTPTYTFGNLPPGAHAVRVVVADPAHSPIAGMARTLEFTIAAR